MIAFVAGLVFELSYLAWIFFADRGWPFRTAAMSMFVGWVSLTGIGTAIHDQAQAPWLIAGYGVGSFCAAWWKRQRART